MADGVTQSAKDQDQPAIDGTDSKPFIADSLSAASLPDSRPERELAEEQRWSAGYQDSDSGVGALDSEPESPIQTPEIQPAWPIVTAQSLTIWTPRFMVIFGLTLVIGLSTAALLTEGWTSKFYPGEWVLLAYMAL